MDDRRLTELKEGPAGNLADNPFAAGWGDNRRLRNASRDARRRSTQGSDIGKGAEDARDLFGTMQELYLAGSRRVRPRARNTTSTGSLDSTGTQRTWMLQHPISMVDTLIVRGSPKVWGKGVPGGEPRKGEPESLAAGALGARTRAGEPGAILQTGRGRAGTALAAFVAVLDITRLLTSMRIITFGSVGGTTTRPLKRTRIGRPVNGFATSTG